MADEEVLDEEQEEGAAAEAAEPSLQDQLKEKIDIKVEDVGSLRKKLTVGVPKDFISERLNEQYGELRRDAAVPGFRKGRAPRRLLEKRFGSEVGDTLVQQLVSTGYMAAIEKTNLKVIGDPMVWIKEADGKGQTLVDVQKALDTIELPAEGDLSFSCEVEIRPEFDLPELENIPIQKPIVTVTDEDIDRQVERLRGLRGHYHAVPDGKVQPDDVIMADITMTSGGTELKKEENVRLAARPQTLDGVAIDNLGEALKGAKVGDTRSVSGDIPDEYAKEEYRGKKAEFEIKVRDLQRLHLPEMNEEFIKSIGFESTKDLREYIKADLESRLSEQVTTAMRGQTMKYLLDNSKVQVPERLSERQSGRVLVRRMLDAYRQGLPPAEVEKHLDELKSGAHEDTIRDLKLFFIMEKLAEKNEDIEVSEAEINSVIAGIAQRQGRRFDRVRDELAKENGLVNIYMQLRDEKLIDLLIAKAKITEAKPEDMEAAKPAKKKAAKKAEAPEEPAASKEKPAEEPKAKAKRSPPKKKGGEADGT